MGKLFLTGNGLCLCLGSTSSSKVSLLEHLHQLLVLLFGPWCLDLLDETRREVSGLVVQSPSPPSVSTLLDDLGKGERGGGRGEEEGGRREGREEDKEGHEWDRVRRSVLATVRCLSTYSLQYSPSLTH